MVGPLSDGARRRGARNVRIGFILLVGVSSGLVAVSGGPTLSELVLVVAAGFLVGGLLLWVLGF